MVPTVGKNQTNHIYNSGSAKEMFDRLRKLQQAKNTVVISELQRHETIRQ